MGCPLYGPKFPVIQFFHRKVLVSESRFKDPSSPFWCLTVDIARNHYILTILENVMVSSREFYCFPLGNSTGLGLAILQSRRQGFGVVFGVIGHGLLNEILLLFSLKFYWSLYGICWSRVGNFTAPSQIILLLSSTEFYSSPLCTESYWSRLWNFTGLLYGILLVSFRAFWGFV